MDFKAYKMDGLGNDFVIIDQRDSDFELNKSQIKSICDRKKIGCDQLILVKKSEKVDAYLIFKNSDGSDSAACGNGTRCVASLLSKENAKSEITFETESGILKSKILNENNIQTNIGIPKTNWNEIPLAKEVDTKNVEIKIDNLNLSGTAVNVGNPHIIFFTEDLDKIQIKDIGPKIESNSLFPEKVNVTFAKKINDKHFKVLHWERGAGLTKACGTAACATAIAGEINKVSIYPTEIEFKLGKIKINDLFYAELFASYVQRYTSEMNGLLDSNIDFQERDDFEVDQNVLREIKNACEEDSDKNIFLIEAYPGSHYKALGQELYANPPNGFDTSIFWDVRDQDITHSATALMNRIHEVCKNTLQCKIEKRKKKRKQDDVDGEVEVEEGEGGLVSAQDAMMMETYELDDPDVDEAEVVPMDQFLHHDGDSIDVEMSDEEMKRRAGQNALVSHAEDIGLAKDLESLTDFRMLSDQYDVEDLIRSAEDVHRRVIERRDWFHNGKDLDLT